MKKKKDEAMFGYASGKTPKRVRLLKPFHADQCWVLEFYNKENEVWTFLDKGKGVPFGPWKMDRAIAEMEMWAKNTNRDAIEWRIRNIETNEIVPQALFGT